MHFGALGSGPTLLDIFRLFRLFQIILVIFGRFLVFKLGLTFADVLRIGGLTIIGANYWEVALC